MELLSGTHVCVTTCKALGVVPGIWPTFANSAVIMALSLFIFEEIGTYKGHISGQVLSVTGDRGRYLCFLHSGAPSRQNDGLAV